MEVTQVLENTLSPNQSTRSNAEQQLAQAAEANFSTYLSTLARELSNEEAQSQIRVAAGLALKNAFSSREFTRLREIQAKWLQQIDPEIKSAVKTSALKTLSSNDARAGQSAAQFIAAIAAIELPRNQWPELMQSLVDNVGQGNDHQKQASLATIGFICESEDADLQNSLSTYSNTILTAVVQGARKEEPNNDIRYAAITALSDSLEFVRSNFENEGERNFIMQVVCEATQAEDTRIQQGAYGCLNRIMALYYDKMRFYMEKALFGLTIQGMKSDEDDVAKLAVEFWCSVCEEEIAIEDDNAMALQDGSTETRPFFNFARIATQEVVPVLLELLTQQDEDAGDDEYNVSRAAYQCLQLWAQGVGNAIVQHVLHFVEANIRHQDWHFRDAAVSAFGAIMEGPEASTLDNLVKQALPVLIGMMDDPVVQVKDSAAYALGRISDSCPNSIDPAVHLQPLVSALFGGLSSNPRMATSCCWALMNLAERFGGDGSSQENPLTPHFDASITHLLQLTARPDADGPLRTAAYEVLNAFISNCGNASINTVASLSDIILVRLEETIPMQQQVVSVEDKLTLEDIQSSLCSVVSAIIQRLDSESKPLADRVMQVLLQLLNTVGGKSSVPDTVFTAIGSLANALEQDFIKYMDAFSPYLFKALSSKDEPGLCAIAIGLVGDIARTLGTKAQPYCDQFMNHLLDNLKSTALSNQVRPAILQCFGDIAQAIGGDFEVYLSIVAQVLDQASSVNVESMISYDMLDYIVSLREGIMDAWGGVIIAMQTGNKAQVLQPYVESIFRLLHVVYGDVNRSESLYRSSMGVIGDLSEAFPNGEFAQFFGSSWVMEMAREGKLNPEYQKRTIQTARWAREQIKRQTGAPIRQTPRGHREYPHHQDPRQRSFESEKQRRMSRVGLSHLLMDAMVQHHFPSSNDFQYRT